MEHYIMDTDGIHCLVNQLGCTMEGSFYISEECADTLEQLIRLVERGGPSGTETRRRLGMLELLPKTLIPLVAALGSEENEEIDTRTVFSLVSRLIMYLTQPLESMCIPGRPASRAMVTSDAEMQDYLWQYKNAFLEKATLPTFFTQIQAILDEAKDGQLTQEDCETVNMFLLIVRNIIFSSPHDVLNSKYTDIILLRLLFQAGLADLIIRLALMDQHVLWCAAIVQILSLVYKNRGSTEVKDFVSSSSGATFLQSNLETEQAEMENLAKQNNEVSHPQRKPKPYHAVLPQKKDTPNSRGSPVESNNSSSSTGMSNSSESWSQYINEDRQSGSQNGGSSGGNEADCSHSSEEKLEEHVEASLMQIETKLCLTLNEFKVRQELVMFTYTMLQKGVFNRLVEALNANVMFNKNHLPDVYFMWLIVHFLRVAQQGEVQFEKIRSCLTVDMVSYLTYVGVCSMEELMVAGGAPSDSVFTMRRYHLAILAIQEIINSIHQHMKLQDQPRTVNAYLRQLTEFLLDMRDLKDLLLVTIRRYRSTSSANLFLRDAVMLNHNFLSLAENVLASTEDGQVRSFNMLQHVQGFATTEVMAQYGSLLENYHSNTPLLNDCIFTMMHHVAGDCGAPHTLMQLPILRAFSDIWDDNHDLPQECQDLIHFTLDSFITQAEGSPYECAKYLFGSTPSHEVEMTDESINNTNNKANTEEPVPENVEEEWSQEECDNLFMLYQDFAEEPLKKVIRPIIRALEDKGILKSERQVLLQMYQQDLCSEEEIVLYASQSGSSSETSMDCEQGENSNHSLGEEQPMVQGEEETNPSPQNPLEFNPLIRDTDSLVQVLQERGLSDMLAWVQTVLLETCYVKIGGRRKTDGKYPEEPVPLHYTLRNKSVPLVSYVEKQELMLRDQVFMFLMEMLGLHFPADTGKAFPCIPHSWSPTDLLKAAKKLGNINFAEQKFSESDVTDRIDEHLANVHKALMTDTSDYKPSSENIEQMSSLWNTFIQQCNINIRQNNALKNSQNLVCS